MTIELSPEQERAIQEAIKSGLVRFVDEFIDVAIAMLPHPKDHTESSRQAAVRHMQEFAERKARICPSIRPVRARGGVGDNTFAPDSFTG